jgi:hypothetical protein
MRKTIVVTSGGFEGENKDKAFGSSPEKGIFVISHLSANHEEGDTRVWFHAFKSTANRLIIYSPDTDTFLIGLPLIKKLTGKSIFVQLKIFSFDSEFIDMTVLTDCLAHDLLLQGIADVEICMQNVYIMSGCDFVSFF